MRITLGKFVLADHGVESVSGFVLNGKRSYQVAEFFRGVDAKVFDRGNRSLSCAFTVRRLHDSVGKAELAVAEHQNEVPGSGDLVIEAGNASKKAVRVLKDAVVVSMSNRYHGCSTFHNYEIVGSSIQMR